MSLNLKHKKIGYITFFLSGICAISSGIIVNLLQDNYGFSYSITGTLLSCMSIGNMLASFISGVLPSKIGTRNTVLLLCSGYFRGYFSMAVSGWIFILILSFLIIGVAKGCALNNCTVLVGNNSKNRAKGMSIMHACYACGALLCPFLISLTTAFSINLPLISIAIVGLVLWLAFLFANLPGIKKEKSKAVNSDFSFLKSIKFWLLTGLLFCQNGAETSVTGWLVTYYKNEGILNSIFSTYTVSIMWTATLIARLLIAFVFPIKNTFKALTLMGTGCTFLYGAMIITTTPLSALILLSGFAFSMAGVNPITVASIGKELNSTILGIMLPIGAIGAIIIPWLTGIVADLAGLQIGMFVNLIPCIGIMILSILLSFNTKNIN